MPLPTLQLFLNGLADEVCAPLAVLKGGVNAVKSPLGESGRGLLVVDLLPTHAPKIDDITNYYKPHFVDICY